jgi:hypothetical protein
MYLQGPCSRLKALAAALPAVRTQVAHVQLSSIQPAGPQSLGVAGHFYCASNHYCDVLSVFVLILGAQQALL